jgi:uncharacterized protein YydD (DUF2326 family)
MIYRIYSTLPSFKDIRFGPGLNVLLAEKSEDATAKQTRNGAGKSSLLEIIHFLCAADSADDSIFRLPQLRGYRFGMEFDLGGSVVSVERDGENFKEVVIRGGSTEGWPLQPDVSDKTGEKVMPVKSWERVLGALMFGLDGSGKGYGTYGPTFRSLFSYFVRRSPGGFFEPHVYFVQSKPVAWQVAITYLLGLDWTIPQEWQLVRDEEDEIKKLRSAVGEGDLAEIVGKKAELRSDIATKETALAKFQARIENFQVLPDFRHYEEEANRLTAQLADMLNLNTLDNALVNQLESVIAEEKAPEIRDLDQMYREAGVVLPSGTLQRFEEVRLFHESVIVNRRTYLSAELSTVQRRVAERTLALERIDGDRREALQLLQSHGALDQFSKLQAEYGKRIAELELLRKRFAAAEKIEGGLAKVRIRRQQLFLRLQQDYSEQRNTLNLAIVAFEEISARLYEKPAKFTPTETNNGPLFKIEVQGERSPGISHMQIYCFDMMLSQITSSRGIGPGFLIHDSHLFDPVDSRQVGIALQLGKELSERLGVQYITTFNSDKQMEFDGDFDIAPYTLPVKLTDATETGGLFGFRFD